MPKPYPPESLAFLESLCRVAPGMGRPCSHEGRMLLQTMIDDGLVEILGKTNCGGWFARATEAGRRYDSETKSPLPG